MMIILCVFGSRYVVVKIVPQNTIAGRLSISDGLLYSSITKSVQKYYGDFGAASIRFGLKCKYCNDQTRVAIIRVKHKIHRFVNSILPLTSIVSISHVQIFGQQQQISFAKISLTFSSFAFDSSANISLNIRFYTMVPQLCSATNSSLNIKKSFSISKWVVLHRPINEIC